MLHHVVEQPLAVDLGDRWNWGGTRRRGETGGVLGLLRPVEGFPEGLVVQVPVEAGEEGGVHGDRTGFETVPEPRGGGARDGVVDPAWGDGVAEFVVEDGLEGGDDLGFCVSL